MVKWQPSKVFPKVGALVVLFNLILIMLANINLMLIQSERRIGEEKEVEITQRYFITSLERKAEKILPNTLIGA